MLELDEKTLMYEGVQRSFKKGLLKKIFALILQDGKLQEWYIDSRNGQAVVLQWSDTTKDPAIYINVTEEEWSNAWWQYISIGLNIKENKTYRDKVEKEKAWAVESIEYSPSEVLALKRWECVKFIMKDRRLK